MRQESQGLSREKEILQLRKGETADDMEKHMKEIRKELEEVDADNRKLREQAFKTGGDMVSVRVTEDDFRVKQEENRALKHEIADLKAKVEQLQASVDEAERGEQGSVKMMEQNLSTLDREAQQLHKETDRLREKVESLAAQQGIGAALVLPVATASKARGGGAQDRSKEVRRLRRENAQHVREIRKAEQEMQLHKLLIRESEQLQADLDQHIGAVSLAHKKKAYPSGEHEVVVVAPSEPVGFSPEGLPAPHASPSRSFTTSPSVAPVCGLKASLSTMLAERHDPAELLRNDTFARKASTAGLPSKSFVPSMPNCWP